MANPTAATKEPRRASNGTLASKVYTDLLTEILNGGLEPDSRLYLESLRAQFGVGNSPIREALNRLAARGFVVAEDQKGFRVAPANRADLAEVINARCMLEELALRESISEGDAEWEERVLLSHHRLSRCPVPMEGADGSTRLEWETRHRDFHLTLISACSSLYVKRYCAELQQQMLRYRNLSPAGRARPSSAAAEHQAICDAALNRDADSAVDLVKSHFKASRAIASADE